MLDGIPFGTAGGIVSNGHCESKAVAEFGLQFGFPGTGAATVAAAGIIGKDEQLLAARVAVGAIVLPPAIAMEWAAKASEINSRRDPVLLDELA